MTNLSIKDPASAESLDLQQHVNYNPDGTVVGNQQGVLLASAARTATTSTAAQTNYAGRGVRVSINVTAVGVTPSVVFTVEVQDPASNVWTAILTSAAIVAVGHTELRVYPGIAVAANVSASDVLGATWRVTATHGNGVTITYSVGYSLQV